MRSLIAINEFTQTLHDGRFLVAGVLILLLLLAATGAGLLNYQSLTQQRQQASQLARAAWLGQKAKNPHSVAHYGMFAFRPTSTLSLLDFGFDTYDW